MLAHFKWNGLWHLLHSMELFLINLAGKFCMQIMQISTSSSDDKCDFFIEACGSFGLCSFCVCLFLRWHLSLFYAFFLLVLHITILRLVSVMISYVFRWCEHSTFYWPTLPSGFSLLCILCCIKYFSKFLEHFKRFYAKYRASHSVSTYVIQSV